LERAQRKGSWEGGAKHYYQLQANCYSRGTTQKERPAHYWEQSSVRSFITIDTQKKPLEEISPGETVRVKLPGKERWTKGTRAEALDHRSYFVKVGDTQYRRNRRHLLKTGERSTPEQGEDINPTLPASEENKPEKVDSPTTESRRSGRVRQAPVWHKDYNIRA